MSKLSRQELSKFVDRNKTGAGFWSAFFIAAWSVQDYESLKHFVWFIDLICNNHPCLECRQHAIDYISRYSPRKCRPDRESCLKWACVFHNKVAQRIGKGMVAYDDLRKLMSLI